MRLPIIIPNLLVLTFALCFSLNSSGFDEKIEILLATKLTDGRTFHDLVGGKKRVLIHTICKGTEHSDWHILRALQTDEGFTKHGIQVILVLDKTPDERDDLVKDVLNIFNSVNTDGSGELLTEKDFTIQILTSEQFPVISTLDAKADKNNVTALLDLEEKTFSNYDSRPVKQPPSFTKWLQRATITHYDSEPSDIEEDEDEDEEDYTQGSGDEMSKSGYYQSLPTDTK